MSKQTLVINGVTFELENHTIERKFIYTRALDVCYNKPSFSKQHIYDFWCDWFRSMGSDWLEHGISSYNYNFFTYNGYFNYDGITYYAYITYAHNRLYKVA